MATLVTLEPAKTYATKDNAIKAVQKLYTRDSHELRYIIATNDAGRFFPVFVGQQAVQFGVHFHFCVVC